MFGWREGDNEILVRSRYFLLRPTKMFSPQINEKAKEKTITKNSNQKAPWTSNHMRALVQLFFSLWFSVFFVTHFFNLLLISFGFLFLLIWFFSFSGTSHYFFKKKKFNDFCLSPFFLHLFWFFIFLFFIFLIWHESKLIYFPSSHFSSQQKKNSFSFLHFFISPTKHIWGKLMACLDGGEKKGEWRGVE